MFIETVKSEGLAHLSYVIGSEGVAAVIDPRRDIDIYRRIAAQRNCRITHVFETHRNEDLISGACALASQTGASVYHGDNPAGPVTYAETTREGDVFGIGKASINVLATPGHTDDSISLAIFDTDFAFGAVAVFTGDTLFVGDTGRTDFYPERKREVAGSLYDSLQKLLSLGDQAIVYPAHGAGSVCGSGMADRDFSTIGHERSNNPALQLDDKEAFIEHKLKEIHLQPPYFKHMEALNLSGAPAFSSQAAPAPLTPDAFKSRKNFATLVDVRSASAFLGAHLQGSIALPMEMISSFAGWLLRPEQSLLLVAENSNQALEAQRLLGRIGYDNIDGFLAPSLVAWAAAGESFGNLAVVNAHRLRQRLDMKPPCWQLLDVRAEHEFSDQCIPGARQIYVGDLPSQLEQLDPDYDYTVMCGSGARATIAASLLLRAGMDKVELFLGSIGAWQSSGYEVATASDDSSNSSAG